jgi:hypothetical protein
MSIFAWLDTGELRVTFIPADLANCNRSVQSQRGRLKTRVSAENLDRG